MSDTVRVGTRGSELALWQAQHVSTLLRDRLSVESRLVVVQTSGDRDHSTALHALAGSGFFTKELQRALTAGDVDLVVHSLKDLPTEEPEGLTLAAVLTREDPADVLLVRPGGEGSGALGLRDAAVLGTSSLRRAAQALALQPGLRIKPLRGNVPTRLSRLRAGDLDAVILAAAGLNRLGSDLSGLLARRLDPTEFLPAPGQGALALEARSADARVTVMASALADPVTAQATTCERALLCALGGGCHLPLGALAVVRDDGVELHAALGTIGEGLTSASVHRCHVRGTSAHEVAQLAFLALTGGAA
jgi:hydroxymethylbilane synthase